MSWNYRVLAHKDEDEVYFQIHSVYYSKEGVADGYSETPSIIEAESIDIMKVELGMLSEALKKPILWARDRFPEEYSENVKDS